MTTIEAKRVKHSKRYKTTICFRHFYLRVSQLPGVGVDRGKKRKNCLSSDPKTLAFAEYTKAIMRIFALKE